MFDELADELFDELADELFDEALGELFDELVWAAWAPSSGSKYGELVDSTASSSELSALTVPMCEAVVDVCAVVPAA